MKHIPASLLVYDNDKHLLNLPQQIKQLGPVERLIPFQMSRDPLTNTPLSSIKLVTAQAAETEILTYFKGTFLTTLATSSGWSNYSASYETFTAGTPLLCTNNSSSASAYSAAFNVVAGKSYTFDFNLNLVSGQYPSFYLASGVGSVRSNTIAASVDGDNTITLLSNYTGSVSLWITNTSNAQFELNPISVFNSSLPEVHKLTSIDYIQYIDTMCLSTPLPEGIYYLKMTDGTNTWYSEWFEIFDIYQNQITGWTNSATDPMEFFAPVGVNHPNGLASNTGNGKCSSTTIPVIKGEEITIIFNLQWASGNMVSLLGQDNTGADIVTGDGVVTNGFNQFTFVCTKTTLLQIAIYATSNFQVSITNFKVIKKYASDFIKVRYTNTNDLINSETGSILYQKSFVNCIYLDTVLNIPERESVEVAAKKNGLPVLQKMSVILWEKIIAYMPLSVYRSLYLIDAHDTIEITDEKGTIYTPDVVRVSDPEIIYKRTVKTEIKFAQASHVWTKNVTNLT